MWIYTCVCKYIYTHTYIFNPRYCHYSWVLYLWICLLTIKCIFNPQINICGTFAIICGQECRQSSEKFETPGTYPAEVWQGIALPFCLGSYIVTEYPFCGVFTATFFTFCTFLLISLFRTAPRPRGEVLSFVSKSKKAVMCFAEKLFVLDTLHSGWVIVLLSVSSILMNQPYILNKMSLNKYT